jgi:outer membrane lipoprotein carrier protein
MRMAVARHGLCITMPRTKLKTINMLKYATTALLLVFMLTSGAHLAEAQSVDAIAQRLNAKYETLETLRAQFTQTMSSQFSDIREKQSGTLVLSGENYRLETGDETYARRGNDVWRYSRSENQVILSDVFDDDGSLSVSDLFFRYDELFRVTNVRSEQIEGAKHFRLTLQPKQEGAFFNEVTLWMRDRDDIVTRLHMVDLNGTIMEFRLRDVQLNPALSANAFDPPSGARVVDLR